MRSLIRDFNVTERVLLVILGLLVVGVAYYYMVHLEVSSELDAAHAERDALAAELDGTLLRAAQLRKMENEMDNLYYGRGFARMESYNNSKAEIALLNDILTAADQYSIAFSGLTRDGNQIRRSFALRFSADSFDTAQDILTKLSESTCRCLIGDLTCTSRNEGEVDYSIVATFYETLVGGKPDAGLPADTGAAS